MHKREGRRNNQRQAQLIHLEHSITRILEDASNHTEALQSVIQFICESEKWTSGAFWYAAGEEGDLRLEVFWASPNVDQKLLKYLQENLHTTTSPNDGLTGAVCHSRELLWIADVSLDGRTSQGLNFGAASVRGTVLFPVIVTNQVIGVFGFSCAEVRNPDDRFTAAIAVISSQIAQYLQRFQAEAALRERAERDRHFAALSSDWQFILDKQWRFCYVAGRDVGSGHDFIGRTHWDPVFQTVPVDTTWPAYEADLKAHQSIRHLLLRRTARDGAEIFYSLSCDPLIRDGVFAGYVGVARDVSEQKKYEQLHFHHAHFDPLTDLANRYLFTDHLNRALAAALRSHSTVAVFMLDLDQFKDINDSMGHGAGDELLKQVAQRLRDTVRAMDTVARLSGDEFAIIQSGVTRSTGAANLAERLVAKLGEPYDLDGRPGRVGVSIGIALFPNDGNDEGALIRAADTALYRAKEGGRSTFCFFEPEMNQRLLERKELERDLRHALEDGQGLALHYQPLVDCGTGVIAGFEALARWDHPVRGAIKPDVFIPLAEDSGLILPLGKWVLDTACAEAARWPSDVRIAVNCSPAQFRYADLAQDVLSTLKRTGLSAERLELEITEGVLITDTSRTLATLTLLKEAGVRISLDDFGTGFSSLSYLQRFPFDKIKIDRSFVWKMEGSADSMAIVRAVIALGHSLRISVTAEGVETVEQLALLRDERCDQLQGYYFSKPIPAQSIAALLQHRTLGGQEMGA